MIATEEPPIETAEAAKKPVVATLVGQFGGIGVQFVPLPGGARAQFDFRSGVGHVREYTDIATFHKEEAFIRRLPIKLHIRTILGDVKAPAAAKGVVGDLIADATMHRHVKYQLLKEIVFIAEIEMLHLEEMGVLGKRKEPEKEEAAPEPPMTERQSAIKKRQMHLLRMGEEHTREIVKSLQRRGCLKDLALLNNYQGLMDGIIETEFPEEALLIDYEKTPENEIVAATHTMVGSEIVTTRGEPEYDTMRIADLEKIAAARGFHSKSRVKILAFLNGPPE